MKETLRKQIETLLSDLKNRRDVLAKQEAQYANDGDYANAMKKEAAASQLNPVINRLTDILKP